jgi:hypothetical protein
MDNGGHIAFNTRPLRACPQIKRNNSMLSKTTGSVLKMLFCAAGGLMLAGCGIQWPHVPEFGFNWVSAEGKSQEQLYQDQTDCRRDVALMYPPDSSGPGDHGMGASNMKAFDDCMRAKGWKKQ